MTTSSAPATIPTTGGALRQRMLEDMAVRDFTPKPQHDYLKIVREFAVFIGRSPGSATAEDLRLYQIPQTQRRAGGACHEQPRGGAEVLLPPRSPTGRTCHGGSSVQTTLASAGGAEPRRVARLIGAAGKLRDRAILAVRLWRGPARRRGGEAQVQRHRQPAHVDSGSSAGKGRRDRNAMLSAEPLSLLRELVARGSPEGCHAARRLAVPGAEPNHTPSPRARSNRIVEGSYPRRRHPQARQPAHIAPQLRNASAGGRRRHPRHPGAAGPCEARQHTPSTRRWRPAPSRRSAVPFDRVAANLSKNAVPTG